VRRLAVVVCRRLVVKSSVAVVVRGQPALAAGLARLFRIPLVGRTPFVRRPVALTPGLPGLLRGELVRRAALVRRPAALLAISRCSSFSIAANPNSLSAILTNPPIRLKNVSVAHRNRHGARPV
jgi:hypothetical protein